MAESTRDVEPNGSLTWAKVITILVTFVTTVGASLAVHREILPPRSDVFTRSEAKLLDLMVERRIEKRINDLDIDRPPLPSRDRIRALEKWVMQNDPNWMPPTELWR